MSYLIAIVSALGILAIAWFLIKKRLIKNSEKALLMIRIKALERLSKKFIDTYGESKSKFLAGAILNKLFYDEPTDEKQIEFAKDNHDLILKEIPKLKNDRKLCEVILQALAYQTSLTQIKMDRHELVEAIMQLKEYGLIDDIPEKPVSPASFINMAQQFNKE